MYQINVIESNNIFSLNVICEGVVKNMFYRVSEHKCKLNNCYSFNIHSNSTYPNARTPWTVKKGKLAGDGIKYGREDYSVDVTNDIFICEQKKKL